MSTYSASFSGILSYTAPGNVNVRETIAVQIPYESSASGFLDIPDQTTGAVTFAVPFGSIASASAVIITNDTQKELKVLANGTTGIGGFSVPAGSAVLAMMPTLASAVPVTSLSVVTTTLVSGASVVGYRVFGV